MSVRRRYGARRCGVASYTTEAAGMVLRPAKKCTQLDGGGEAKTRKACNGISQFCQDAGELDVLGQWCIENQPDEISRRPDNGDWKLQASRSMRPSKHRLFLMVLSGVARDKIGRSGRCGVRWSEAGAWTPIS